MSKTNTNSTTSPEDIETVISAVDSYVATETTAELLKIDSDKYQLRTMRETIANVSEPITEGDWNAHYAKRVAAKLEAAKRADGKPRYSSPASRYTMMSRIKLATMGLSRAADDKAYVPGQRDTSLQRYVNRVRPILQRATVLPPPTHRPPPRPKKLPEGLTYWLVGSMDENGKGQDGKLDKLAQNDNRATLEAQTKLYGADYELLSIILAPKEVQWQPAPDPKPLTDRDVTALHENAATVAGSFSPAEAA